MTDQTTTPASKLSVTVNGKEVSLFMSFGMLNKLLSTLKTEEAALGAFYDEELRSKVLEEVLKARGDFGMAEKWVIDELDMTTDDVSDLFKWVAEHVVDFFLKNGEKTQHIAERYKPRFEALQSFLNGPQS